MKEYLQHIKMMAEVDIRIVEWKEHPSNVALEAYQDAFGYLQSSLQGIVGYIDNHAIPSIVAREIADDFAEDVQTELRRGLKLAQAEMMYFPDGFYSGGEVRAIRIGDNGNNDVGFELVTSEDGTICDFAVKYGKIFYQDELTDAEALVDELTS